MGRVRSGAATDTWSHSGQARAAVIIAVAVAALVVRVLPYALPGQILAVREYDDGVMLGGAIAMLAGHAPYTDFFYLHPPGSLLLLTPAATAASLIGEPAGMAAARVAMIVLGVLNTVLIAVLLRDRGAFAALVGAGLYAAWPVIVDTERTVLLEPIIVCGLLISLWLIRRRTSAAVAAAGACLGLAATVKVWAIIDVVIVAAVVGVTMGGRMLGRYIVASTAAITIICLPFFSNGPAAMWTQVIAAQLNRAGTPASIPGRLSTMSLAQGVHAIDLRIPGAVWVIFFLGLLVAAVLPLAADIKRRTRLPDWAEASWWSVITVVHAAVILCSAGYFYHYAVWLLAPLCLSVGYSAGYVRLRGWRTAIIGVLTVVLVLTVIGAVRHPGRPLLGATALAAWAGQRECVWADSSQLLSANALRRNLDRDCAMDIDAFASFLVLDPELARETDLSTRSSIWKSRQWEFLARADGVILAGNTLPEWWTDAQLSDFKRHFEFETAVGQDGLWTRRSPSGTSPSG